MQLTREINRLFAGLLVVFLLVAVAAAYWAIIGPVTILQREDNPRLVEAEARLMRGHIYDRRNNLLVASMTGTNQRQQRQYLHPETSSITGYASLRYGTGGAEAAYDALLRGDNLPRNFNAALADHLLHRPQRGSDIRLSLDLGVQQVVAEAMHDLKGAVVVLAVPSGDILGLVSAPGYNPQTLDESWDELAADPDTPFFNRALQGNYQPGGTLQTPLMAAALLHNQPLDDPIENATVPVALPELEVNCAVRLPYETLSLQEAYAFSCPAPFARLAESLGQNTLDALLNTFHFNQRPVLGGFMPAAEASSTPAPLLNSGSVIENALGQGGLTTSPLEMALMAAAIVNDGNAPQPNLLLATRAPDASDWTRVVTVRPTLPYSTDSTARRLQDLMRGAVAIGAAANAGRPGMDIGGHATLAYSGEESQAWFIGFATLPGERGIAVAVVLEDSADPGLAADIGGDALAAAHAALQTP